MKGVVKWFDGKKGFGFLEREDGEGDIFVHFSAIMEEGYRTLNEGVEVTFDLASDPKNKRTFATNVVVTT